MQPGPSGIAEYIVKQPILRLQALNTSVKRISQKRGGSRTTLSLGHQFSKIRQGSADLYGSSISRQVRISHQWRQQPQPPCSPPPDL